jgi:hypothetical protein
MRKILPDPKGLPSLRLAFLPGPNTAQEKKAAGSVFAPLCFLHPAPAKPAWLGLDAKRLQTCLQPFFLVA